MQCLQRSFRIGNFTNRLPPRWLRSLSKPSAGGSISYTHELSSKIRTAGRGAARVCPSETPYKPHMTLYTNLLDRAKVDDGSRPMFGSRPIDPTTGEAIGDYEWKTFAEFLDQVDETAAGIKHALGLKRQDMVGIFSRSQYEWTLVEQSCNHMAYTLVPLYETLGPSTVPYILNHTEMKVVFCAKEQTAKLLHCLAECPHLKTIVQYESNLDEQQVAEADERGVKIWTLEDVVKIGRNHSVDAEPPKPEDLSTICYTSGTTGTPKGVLVTHANFVRAVNAYRPMIKANRDNVYFSFLPLPHVAKRFLHAMMITEGEAIGFYHGNVARILDDVQALHPTVFVAVPRLMNCIFDQLKHKVASSGDAKQVEHFYQALEEKKRLNLLKYEKYDAELLQACAGWTSAADSHWRCPHHKGREGFFLVRLWCASFGGLSHHRSFGWGCLLQCFDATRAPCWRSAAWTCHSPC